MPQGPATTGQRLMGLDVGSRTIGVALSDELGITAQPLETIRRRARKNDLNYLARIVRERAIGEIVIGLPLHMSGDEGPRSQDAREFAEALREKFELPVHLQDERLTTTEASRVLRETNMGIGKRGEVIDQLAAVLILQQFLDARRQRATIRGTGP